MDQISPADISRIVVRPPRPGTNPARGWSVTAWRRGNETVPDESYGTDSAALALTVAGKLFAGTKVELADLYAGLSRGGRPHAAR